MPTKFCRHIRTNGERCGSPALTSEVFCYYHVQLSKRHRSLNPLHEQIETVIHPMTLQDGTQREPHTAEYTGGNPAVPLQLDFPALEDRHSIQLGVAHQTECDGLVATTMREHDLAQLVAKPEREAELQPTHAGRTFGVRRR